MNPVYFVVFFVGTVLGIFTGIALGNDAADFDLRTEAAERGYAEYCIPRGNWAWKGECE